MLLLVSHSVLAAPLERPIAPPMGMGLAGVSSYSDNWQFTDMMKHGREWRAPKGWTVVEDAYGWPLSLRSEAGETAPIGDGKEALMWLYNRQIAGDIVLTWEGDGDVRIKRRPATLLADDFPASNRRVYHWDDRTGGVFDLVVARSNPQDHVRNIRVWMPGHEGGAETFHPLWKQVIEPFPYLRFMDWGRTNNNEQIRWADRKTPSHMRQTQGVAWEYMLQLCNETGKDAWICIPAQADDEYVRQLAALIQRLLKPDLRVYVEYSNEIWNPAFAQTRWLWDQAADEIAARGLIDARGQPLKKWEYGPTLCGRRSAEIWKLMSGVIEDPDRIVRTVAHFRWLERCMAAALDPAHGDGRVDLIALNGYFISQDSLHYAMRDLDNWDLDEVTQMLQQQHLLGKAQGWREEIAAAHEQWPGIPITCYEGGQHFANPFSKGLQGEQLVARMLEVNADRRIRDVYRTALETWHLAGADGFTAFVECGTWSKYGCWGHKQYPSQPLEDQLDSRGKVIEPGAHKYAALLDYIARRQGQVGPAPEIGTHSLPDAVVGVAYDAALIAAGGRPPYSWSLLGGTLTSVALTREVDARVNAAYCRP
jgi:hypothetical protein